MFNPPGSLLRIPFLFEVIHDVANYICPTYLCLHFVLLKELYSSTSYKQPRTKGLRDLESSRTTYSMIDPCESPIFEFYMVGSRCEPSGEVTAILL